MPTLVMRYNRHYGSEGLVNSDSRNSSTGVAFKSRQAIKILREAPLGAEACGLGGHPDGGTSAQFPPDNQKQPLEV